MSTKSNQEQPQTPAVVLKAEIAVLEHQRMISDQPSELRCFVNRNNTRRLPIIEYVLKR